jgi:shikimate kinase
MGTGKTAVGEILAKRLQREFVDMDALIEEREQRSISRIFAEDGEQYFRAIERQLVRELANKQNMVIGTGGGAVLNPDNIRDFNRSGILICLNARPETILTRVQSQKHRPLLEDGEKAECIRSILEERKSVYASVPHQVDTDTLSRKEVTELILQIAGREN